MGRNSQEPAVRAAGLPSVLRCLEGYRFRFGNEDDLQQGIALALDGAGIRYRREVRAGRASRLDFLCEDGLAIEVKVFGNTAPSSLLRQLEKYAALAEVVEILVVTSVPIRPLPTSIDGKPVTHHYLMGSAF